MKRERKKSQRKQEEQKRGERKGKRRGGKGKKGKGEEIHYSYYHIAIINYDVCCPYLHLLYPLYIFQHPPSIFLESIVPFYRAAIYKRIISCSHILHIQSF